MAREPGETLQVDAQARGGGTARAGGRPERGLSDPPAPREERAGLPARRRPVRVGAPRPPPPGGRPHPGPSRRAVRGPGDHVGPAREPVGRLYAGSGGEGVRLDFPDRPNLAVWMFPGATYVCVEPWHGLPSPEGFRGEDLGEAGRGGSPSPRSADNAVSRSSRSPLWDRALQIVASRNDAPKPSTVARPTNCPPWSKASGIIVSASIVRTAPAAKASISATTRSGAPPSRP